MNIFDIFFSLYKIFSTKVIDFVQYYFILFSNEGIFKMLSQYLNMVVLKKTDCFESGTEVEIV